MKLQSFLGQSFLGKGPPRLNTIYFNMLLGHLTETKIYILGLQHCLYALAIISSRATLGIKLIINLFQVVGL